MQWESVNPVSEICHLTPWLISIFVQGRGMKPNTHRDILALSSCGYSGPSSPAVPKQPPVYRPFEQNPFHEEHQEDRYGPRQTYGGYWGTSQNAYEPNTYDAPHQSNSRYFGKNRPPQQAPDQTSKSKGDLDSMMEGIENKALRKEVEQLRKKVAQYEKGDL
jgi:hypothetical protein